MGRLHLTLVMLKLMTAAEVKSAVAALRGCQAGINELLMASGGLTVSLTGLEYMNDDPAQVVAPLLLNLPERSAAESRWMCCILKLAGPVLQSR